MNTSTQAMNNVNKVQTPAAGNKPKQGQQESPLNFTELFSSALGQSAPTAQLNSIESQLRESLYQQNKPKKNNESTANAEAAQATQAAVWAQRNWMQTAPVQPATPAAANEVIKDTEAPKQAVAPDNTAPTDSADASTSGVNKPASSSDAQHTPEHNADKNTEQAAKVALPGTVTNPANSEVALDKTAQTAELALNSAANGEPVAQVINPTKPEQTTGNELAGADKARPDLKTTAQLKADATIANSTVQIRADTAQGNGPGNVGNAVQVQLNQQVAPQITQQIAQQAQAMGEGFGEEGLKVGQKILATGNLQSAGTATGIAAGTNGLTGTAGSAQQTLIKTPVNQPGFAKELGQTVQWAIGKNLSTVDIRVNPESFGPMNMRLVQKGQQVQLVIRTQDEASANLLTQALSGLKEVLAQNGLQLNQVQIQHSNTPSPQGQSNNNQAQFDQNRNQGQGHGQHAGGGDNSQAESGAPTNTATARKPEGKLDLFA